MSQWTSRISIDVCSSGERVCLFFEQPEARVTACRSTGSNGLFLERIHHYDSVSKSLEGNIENIDMSCGKRRRRPRKCTRSKFRNFFARIWLYYCGMLCVFCGLLCLCGLLCFCVVVCLRLFIESGLGVVFLHGEARVTSCWKQGVTHFKKRAGLRMWLNPIASLMLCYWR